MINNLIMATRERRSGRGNGILDNHPQVEPGIKGEKEKREKRSKGPRREKRFS